MTRTKIFFAGLVLSLLNLASVHGADKLDFASISGALFTRTENGLAFHYSAEASDEIIPGEDSFHYIADSAAERKHAEAAQKRAAQIQAKEDAAKKAASEEKKKKPSYLFSDGGYIGYLYSPGLPLGFSLGSIRNTVGLFLDAQADAHFKAWDALAGLNIRIVPSYLWLSAGGGVYSNEIGQFGGVVSLGAFVKVWHMYASVKYRYIIGDAYDPLDIWNINHLDIGLGFVWKTKK